MDKKDLDKLYKKYEPVLKKTGDQLSKAMKAAEKDVAKMYKIAQTHVEIQMGNLQKEKLYHSIGKDVAAGIMKGTIDIPGMEKYKKELNKLNLENEKRKKSLEKKSKEALKKTAPKKKAAAKKKA
jgi:hypothetical protein